MPFNRTGKVQQQRGQVLIVEDNPDFRRLLSKTIEKAGFKTREAENGKVARTMFDLGHSNFELVISDIRMPELDGVTLLAHVRKNSRVPFILMTGFSEILETKAAYDLGANEFLLKPFKTESVLAAIDRCLGERNAATVEKDEAPNESHRFFPLDVRDLVATTRLQFDLYVKVNTDRFVKIAQRGDEIPTSTLNELTERKVDFLYMTERDFASYVDFTIRVSNAAAANRSIAPDTKVRLMKHSAQSIVERCFLSEIDPDSLTPARDMVEQAVKFSSESKEALVALTASNYGDECQMYSQGVAVAIIASLIARRNGWTSASTQLKITVSGLLHDIGLRELPAELLAKSRIQMSPDEISLYESHSARGRDLLASVRGLPEDIAQIVYQHHERPDGTGFPEGLKGEAIHPLARLIGLSSQFVDLVFPTGSESRPMDPIEAVSEIYYSTTDHLDRVFLGHLRNVFEEASNKKKAGA